jgi:hypothetical protein
MIAFAAAAAWACITVEPLTFEVVPDPTDTREPAPAVVGAPRLRLGNPGTSCSNLTRLEIPIQRRAEAPESVGYEVSVSGEPPPREASVSVRGSDSSGVDPGPSWGFSETEDLLSLQWPVVAETTRERVVTVVVVDRAGNRSAPASVPFRDFARSARPGAIRMEEAACELAQWWPFGTAPDPADTHPPAPATLGDPAVARGPASGCPDSVRIDLPLRLADGEVAAAVGYVVTLRPVGAGAVAHTYGPIEGIASAYRFSPLRGRDAFPAEATDDLLTLVWPDPAPGQPFQILATVIVVDAAGNRSAPATVAVDAPVAP